MMDSNTSKIPQECISGYGTFKGNISGRVYNLSYGDTFQSETPESFSGSITIRNTCADITTIGGNALLGLFQLEQGVWINFLLIKDLPLVTTCGIDLEDAISLPSVTGSEKGIRSVRVNKNIASGRGILTFTPSSTESDLGVLNRDDDHQNGVITYTINSSPLVGGVWTFKTEEAQEIELQANYAKAVAGHYSGTMTARISCE
ncbi:hypothetical protein ACIQCX_24425 [Enterobacter cancerogenus]|uniref:hypothetical protein n=1 Tax=Enterobacter cancerogenus TaxID=69218 RepID=UPI00381A1D57